jgi:hypothetical protein
LSGGSPAAYGLGFWLTFLPLLLNRVIFHHEPLPGRLAPTLARLVASPASLCHTDRDRREANGQRSAPAVSTSLARYRIHEDAGFAGWNRASLFCAEQSCPRVHAQPRGTSIGRLHIGGGRAMHPPLPHPRDTRPSMCYGISDYLTCSQYGARRRDATVRAFCMMLHQRQLFGVPVEVGTRVWPASPAGGDGLLATKEGGRCSDG